MKHLVLLAATLGLAAMTAHSEAAELLRSVGVGHGAGYHAASDCSTCNQGGGGGVPLSGYGGYSGGCCNADYPQACCANVWDGYCDEPRCHFWSRLHARLTTDRGCGTAPACCPPEYGCNTVKKLFHHSSDCCVEEEASCEAETVCEPCCKKKLFSFPKLGLFKSCKSSCEVAECEPSCEAEEATAECCEPCCKHKGIFGWLHRACGGSNCQSDVCTECATESSESSDLPPAPPATTMNDPV
jgi:hypothetical protein